VESPFLEIFKPCLDAVLCSLLWVTLLGQGVGLGDPQRSLPTPTMLGFCKTGQESPVIYSHHGEAPDATGHQHGPGRGQTLPQDPYAPAQAEAEFDNEQ